MFYLRVGRQANASGLSDLTEEYSNSLLVHIEGQVADEKSVAGRADGVAMLLGTVSGTIARVALSGTSIGVVQVQSTVVKLEALHGIVSLGSVGAVVEVDIAEATAAAAHLVSDNTSANKTLKLLEGLVESIVINVPAQVAGEQGGGTLAVSLGLLGGSVNLVVSLALLGSRSVLSLLLGFVRLLRVIIAVI